MVFFLKKRRKAAAGLFKDQWMGKRSFIDKRHWSATIKNFDIICERAKNGEKIRIWYGTDADSYTSYMWLVSELQQYDCEISAVGFNDLAYEIEPRCYNWVRTDADDLLLFVQAERIISGKQRINISKRWADICSHSHPLRIVLNGHVVSVDQNFYDSMILENLPNKPFCAAHVMREMLNNITTDIPYYFINRRMCDLFREHCEIIGERGNAQGYLFDRLIFQKKCEPPCP